MSSVGCSAAACSPVTSSSAASSGLAAGLRGTRRPRPPPLSQGRGVRSRPPVFPHPCFSNLGAALCCGSGRKSHRVRRSRHGRRARDRAGDQRAACCRRGDRRCRLLATVRGFGAVPHGQRVVGSDDPPGEHRAQRGLRARRLRGDRAARAARRPRQQRGHHHGSHRAEDDPGGVGPRVAGQPSRRVLHVPGRPPAHDRARLRPHRQHQLRDRRDRQHRAGELRGLEGGPVRAHDEPGARVRQQGDHRQHGCAGVHPDRDGGGRSGRTSWRRSSGRIPCGRLGEADEVARVVEFLVDPASSYITGDAYSINGGLAM